MRIVLAVSCGVLAAFGSGCWGPECTHLTDCETGHVCSADGLCLHHASGPLAGHVAPSDSDNVEDNGIPPQPALGPGGQPEGALLTGQVGPYTNLKHGGTVVVTDTSLSATVTVEDEWALVMIWPPSMADLLRSPGVHELSNELSTHAVACADRDGQSYDEPVTGTVEIGETVDASDASEDADALLQQGYIPLRIRAQASGSDFVLDALVPPIAPQG